MVRRKPVGSAGASTPSGRRSLEARGTPANHTGRARSALGAGVAIGAPGSAGSERVASGEALGQGGGASNTSPRTAVPVGGAATVRPSSLHIGTAAAASDASSTAASITSTESSLGAAVRALMRLKMKSVLTFTRPEGVGILPVAGGFTTVRVKTRRASPAFLNPASRFLCLHCATLYP